MQKCFEKKKQTLIYILWKSKKNIPNIYKQGKIFEEIFHHISITVYN